MASDGICKGLECLPDSDLKIDTGKPSMVGPPPEDTLDSIISIPIGHRQAFMLKDNKAVPTTKSFSIKNIPPVYDVYMNPPDIKVLLIFIALVAFLVTMFLGGPKKVKPKGLSHRQPKQKYLYKIYG